ncbi:MAG: hypothetical protein NZ853_05255 [Leptospiraceae bacterium]|nr:hypothetical protein [Leptospiraceae bacterium]
MKKYLLLVFLITFCGRTYQGDFYWRAVNLENIVGLEKYIFQPNQYYLGRENLYFSEDDTIWWMYKFENRLFLDKKFYAVLYNFTNTLQPIEIDLRLVEVEYQDGEFFLRDYYHALNTGHYILKLASKIDSEPFDEVHFRVLSKEEIQFPIGSIGYKSY